MLWILGQNAGNPLVLGNVSEAASIHKMGPRPLFCTPCRGVKISENTIGVLVHIRLEEVEDETDAYHPGMTREEYTNHPLRRLYDAKSDSFMCWNPDEKKCVVVKHEWVEKNVIPMCSVVLIKSWADCMKKLVPHMTCDGLAKGSTKKDKSYVMAKIAPPRSGSEYEEKIWVSIEVRHTVGNLKNMPYADMITIQVPPADLRPMVNATEYKMQRHGNSAAKYTSNKRKRTSEKSEEETLPVEEFIVNRFIYAGKMSM